VILSSDMFYARATFNQRAARPVCMTAGKQSAGAAPDTIGLCGAWAPGKISRVESILLISGTFRELFNRSLAAAGRADRSRRVGALPGKKFAEDQATGGFLHDYKKRIGRAGEVTHARFHIYPMAVCACDLRNFDGEPS